MKDKLVKDIIFTTDAINRDLNWDDIHICDKLNCGMIEQVTENIISWHTVKPCDLIKVIHFIHNYFKIDFVEVDSYFRVDDNTEIYLSSEEFSIVDSKIVLSFCMC